jgi:hypothetical protein
VGGYHLLTIVQLTLQVLNSAALSLTTTEVTTLITAIKAQVKRINVSMV